MIGVITPNYLFKNIEMLNLESKNSCIHCLSKDFLILDVNTPLSVIQNLLKSNNGILLKEAYDNGRIKNIYVISSSDILEYLGKEIK